MAPDHSDTPSEQRRGFSARLSRWWDNHGSTINILGLIALVLLVYLSPSIFHFVAPGEAAVRWRRFGAGTQTDKVYLEGLQVTPPWDKLFIYDVRVQQVEHPFSAISSNGLTIGVVTSIRFRPKTMLLGVLHREIGPDYLQKIVVPEVQALIRRIFGEYSPEEIYTTKRYLIQNSLDAALGEIGQRYIELDDLLIKTITLPAPVKHAIENKLTEEQRYLEMQYRIAREEEEAKRKIIEGVGVNEFQKLVSQSLTSQLLQYKSIEAAYALAQSTNSKLVVFGGGEDIPIILDAGFKPDAAFGGAGTNSVPLEMPQLDFESRLGTNLFESAERVSFNETNRVQNFLNSTNLPPSP